MCFAGGIRSRGIATTKAISLGAVCVVLVSTFVTAEAATGVVCGDVSMLVSYTKLDATRGRFLLHDGGGSCIGSLEGSTVERLRIRAWNGMYHLTSPAQEPCRVIDGVGEAVIQLAGPSGSVEYPALLDFKRVFVTNGYNPGLLAGLVNDGSRDAQVRGRVTWRGLSSGIPAPCELGETLYVDGVITIGSAP